jgi:parallel beta-helix repeat protein
MKQLIARHPVWSIAVSAVAGALVIGIVWAVVAATGRGPVGAPSGEPAGPEPDTSASPSATSTPDPGSTNDAATYAVKCDYASPTVSNAEELSTALASAQPGDVIVMAPGSYVGNFVATASGTASAPIQLCGSADSVLDGDDESDGYVFHLDGAQYWRLSGFTVTNGQKGVMADGTVGTVIEGLTVKHIGDEAIHLRKASTDNLVIGNTISETGLRKPKFGEGVYIGTAESNWCDISDCQPDASDRNTVEGNTISGTSSESIDLKEGSSDGIVRNNTFDGSALEGDADSWVDVKGNGYLIEGNSGVNSPMDGFQTHEILDGWGTDNIFRNNTAAVNGDGFGYSLTPELDNVVECSNAASGAAEGVTNVTCAG